MPDFGERILERGMKGPDVELLQIMLAGFRGTLWDGDFGPGTELQVISFRRDFMGEQSPVGRVDKPVMESLRKLADAHPLDWKVLKCQCGECGGFGQGRFKGEYKDGIQAEEYHRYEYPGIHKVILWSQVAARFYVKKETDYGNYFTETCGYRCLTHNKLHGRTTTNHMGKAIDSDVVGHPEDSKNPSDQELMDTKRSDKIRGLLVERSNAQIKWLAQNRKSLEPQEKAATWIHLDVRSYQPRYLEDRFFVKSEAEFLNFPTIRI